jgi:hypothetical protein
VPKKSSRKSTEVARTASEPAVGLGATREELRRLLGEPTDTMIPTRNRRQSMIWKYGEIEYHFGDDGRVWIVYSEEAHGNPQELGRLQE